MPGGELVHGEVGEPDVTAAPVEGVAGEVAGVREQHDLLRARGQRGAARLDRDGARVAPAPQTGRGVDGIHPAHPADDRGPGRRRDGGAVRGLPEREVPVGEARVGPGAGVDQVDGGLLADVDAELAAEADELLPVLLAHGPPPALGKGLRWGERAQTVEMEPYAGHRLRTCPPLPRLGERGGRVMVPDDAGHRMLQLGQTHGERVGLLVGEGRDAQGTGRGPLQEGRPDLARALQPAENGARGAVLRRHPFGSVLLGHGQRHGVQSGPRPQEVPGPGVKVMDVGGEVPVVRTHASCFPIPPGHPELSGHGSRRGRGRPREPTRAAGTTETHGSAGRPAPVVRSL